MKNPFKKMFPETWLQDELPDANHAHVFDSVYGGEKSVRLEKTTLVHGTALFCSCGMHAFYENGTETKR